jgi:hypothetical protein
LLALGLLVQVGGGKSVHGADSECGKVAEKMQGRCREVSEKLREKEREVGV